MFKPYAHPDDSAILITTNKNDFLRLEDPTSQFSKAVILLLPEEQAVIDRLKIEAAFMNYRLERRDNQARFGFKFEAKMALEALAGQMLDGYFPDEWQGTTDRNAGILDNGRNIPMKFHRDKYRHQLGPHIRILRVLKGDGTLFYTGAIPTRVTNDKLGEFYQHDLPEPEKISSLPFNALVAFWSLRDDRGFSESFMHSAPEGIESRVIVSSDVILTPRI